MALTTIPAVESLFSEISRFGHLSDHSVLTYSLQESAKYGRLTIFTATNKYSINFKFPENGDEGYLGCGSESRMPRAGEDWHRGRDLADGPLTAETWHKILTDIVSYEMVKVHKQESDTGVLPAGPEPESD